MNTIRKVLSVPQSERGTYVQNNAEDFGKKYPVLTMMLCKRADFDIGYLKHMIDVLDENDKESATQLIHGELQRKYLVPVIERLEQERKNKQMHK